MALEWTLDNSFQLSTQQCLDLTFKRKTFYFEFILVLQKCLNNTEFLYIPHLNFPNVNSYQN